MLNVKCFGFFRGFGEGSPASMGRAYRSTATSKYIAARSLISIEPFELMTTESVFQVLPKLRSRSNSRSVLKITDEAKG